jgi:hypothetical protein
MLPVESLNLSGEINDPDFQRKIGNRGESLTVEESGKYTVSLKLEGGEVTQLTSTSGREAGEVDQE